MKNMKVLMMMRVSTKMMTMLIILMWRGCAHQLCVPVPQFSNGFPPSEDDADSDYDMVAMMIMMLMATMKMITNIMM